jgi:uncharacterized membrane protein
LGQEIGGQHRSSEGATPRPRIQALSDLIFGLALSIGALTLVGRQPASAQELIFALALYAFSFMILIRVWQVYSSITSILPSETSLLVDLNLVLLFFVSIEPYLFNELFALGGAMYPLVSGTYAVDLAAMFLILAFFAHTLIDEDRKLIPKSLLGRYRVMRNVNLVVAAIFAISIVPFFGDTVVLYSQSAGATYVLTLRSVIWIGVLFVGWGGRLFGERRRPSA